MGPCGVRFLAPIVDGRNPANQLRLVVYPTIYKVLAPSQMVSRISEPSTVYKWGPITPRSGVVSGPYKNNWLTCGDHLVAGANGRDRSEGEPRETELHTNFRGFYIIKRILAKRPQENPNF